MTSYLHWRWTNLYEIRQPNAKWRAEYCDVVKIETGSRIRYSGRFFNIQTGSSYILAMDEDMSMKFGLQTDIDLRKKVTPSNAKPEVVLCRRIRHLEIIYDVITPLRVARF